MIEDKIQLLRQAAMLTSDDDEVGENWCIIAGNDQFIDDVAYKAIVSRDTVNILFREHVVINEGRFCNKYDFIMLKGLTTKIRSFKSLASQNGAAFIQITPYYIKEKPNLMVLIAPDDINRKCISVLERFNVDLSILIESQTTGFVEREVKTKLIPKSFKESLKPFYNVSDVVLSALLVSVKNDEDIEKVQSVATSKQIFVIDFHDIDMGEI